MTDLKPCPYCGGITFQVCDFSKCAFVQCTKCGMTGPHKTWGSEEDRKENCQVAWNVMTKKKGDYNDR